MQPTIWLFRIEPCWQTKERKSVVAHIILPSTSRNRDILLKFLTFRFTLSSARGHRNAERLRKKNQHPEDDARRADDSEINERLVEHLKANAIRPDTSATADDRLPQKGFFGEAYALLSLVGLMIVAYVYSLLVGQEA